MQREITRTIDEQHVRSSIHIRQSSIVHTSIAVVIDHSCRHLTSWVRLHVLSGIAAARSFDKQRDFVLDTKEISPIIYIWYEGGWLSPPVVTAKRPSEVEPLILRRAQWRRRLPRARRRRPRRSGSFFRKLEGVLVGAPHFFYPELLLIPRGQPTTRGC